MRGDKRGRGEEREKGREGGGGRWGEVKLQNRQCNISNVINFIDSVIIGNSQTYFCHFSFLLLILSLRTDIVMFSDA